MKEIFTSLVRVRGNDSCRVISVKSNKEVERELFLEFSKVLGRLYVSTPIKIGEIICKNILNTGVDIICTQNVNK